MAERKPASKDARKTAKRPAPANGSAGFTDEEKAAMREYVQERKTSGENGESQLLARLAGMAAPDRALGERIHAIVKASAPGLTPKTWYGMPAYANKDGNVVCFFQDARKFKSRYATLGFSDKAHLDDGAMWPAGFALKEIGPAEEAKIAALVKKAVS